MRSIRVFRCLAGALLLASVTACASEPTETRIEAVQRVEALVAEAFAHLPAGATLEFSDGSDRGSCDDVESGRTDGLIFVEKRYDVVPQPGGTWAADQTIPALVAFWAAQGYRVYDDGRDRRDPKFVVDTADGYAVIIKGYDRGDHYDYTLSGSSPCIYENGTPTS
jgi:hypothetical protein